MFLGFLSVLYFGMGQAPPLLQTLGSSTDLECSASASRERMAGVSVILRKRTLWKFGWLLSLIFLPVLALLFRQNTVTSDL